MQLTTTERLDLINIGLMLASACVAMVLPFELFLFVYAVLGPLHYLTEISWLHDRNYFTKSKYDAMWLVLIGIIFIVLYLGKPLELEFPPMFDANLMYIALLSALIFITIKNTLYKIGGILVLVFTSQISHHFGYVLTIFVPTLIHVYVFTAFFIIYGAIKSNSRLGFVSAGTILLMPFLLYNLFPNTTFNSPTTYSQEIYRPFAIINNFWLKFIDKVPAPNNKEEWNFMVFHSARGVLLMRFIAFAYTYHYLNWFSKTKVIRWNEIPKARFVLVIVLWLASIGLYMYNYIVGLQWLLLLSFWHVLLEFPLNFISMIGIGNAVKNKVFKAAK